MTDMDVDVPEELPLVSKVVLLPDGDTLMGVHVIEHTEQFSANVLRFVMQLVLYAINQEPSLDNLPMALMHYLPTQQRVELSLSDTGAEQACLELRQKAETEGLSYFLRRFAQAPRETCTLVELRYSSLADITTGKVVSVVESRAPLPTPESCAPYHEFFSVARAQ